MTLIVTINGPESIWLLSDRRLSSKDRAPKDDARKVMFLETNDGVSILGYAGLGATGRGTEPADWMSAVLRGRNLPLEQSLGVLAEAMKKQFPRHMVRLAGSGAPAHNVLITAFVGNDVKFYTIDIAFAPDRKRYRFRYTRHVTDIRITAKALTPRLGIGGSGATYLDRDKKWIRPLLRLVRAYDRHRISSYAVADHLSNLNYEVHMGVSDKSVGPRCIVAWRNRQEGIHKGGGGHHFYTGTTRDASSPSLPTIANGTDLSALLGVLMPHTSKMFEAMRVGEPTKEMDNDELNVELARLPDKPDENLR